MAIRVKKLAKELRSSSQVILLALSDLGYDRYKSPMDMVADTAAAKLRKLARSKGLPSLPASKPAAPPAPAPRPRPAVQRAPSPAPAPRAAPQGARQAPKPSTPDPLDIPIADFARRTPSAQAADLGAINQEIQQEERRLQARSQALAARTRELETAHGELERQREALRRERDALQAEKAQLLEDVDALRGELETRAEALDAIEAGGVPVSTLLEERGLRGHDEQGRALGALAKQRLLERLLTRLRVIDPEPVRRLLREKLVLAEVDASAPNGVAVVVVPADRSELPSQAGVDRVRRELAGEFLLSGFTRARLVGGAKMRLLLRLLAGDLDPRVQLSVVPAQARDVAQVPDDVADVDVLILWGVSETESARLAYDAANISVVRVSTEGGLQALVTGVRQALLEA